MAIGNLLAAGARLGPGLLRGQREREETDYQRSQEQAVQQRRQQAEQRAYDQWLMQFNEQQTDRQARRDDASRETAEAAARRQRALDQAKLITQDPAEQEFFADNPQTLAGIVQGRHRQPTPERFSTYTGPDGRAYSFNPATGEYTLAQGVGARPAPVGGGVGGRGGAGGGRPGGQPTATEQSKEMLRASALPSFQNMIEMDDKGNADFKMKRSGGAAMIRGALPKSAEQPLLGIASRLPGVGKWVEEDLLAEQASIQFIDSWIRAVSGAAVPETELQRYLKTYTPQAFEPESLRKQKARAWVTLQNALTHAAGRAAEIADPEERARYALSIVASGGVESYTPRYQENPF